MTVSAAFAFAVSALPSVAFILARSTFSQTMETRFASACLKIRWFEQNFEKTAVRCSPPLSQVSILPTAWVTTTIVIALLPIHLTNMHAASPSARRHPRPEDEDRDRGYRLTEGPS